MITVMYATGDKEQPPSGGCVLKHYQRRINDSDLIAAAFGRLCVETLL